VKLRRPAHPERVAIIAIVLLVVVNVAIIGTRSEVRGNPPSPSRPSAILGLQPQEGDHIIPQAPIVVSLKGVYTGQLSVDGRLIPLDQVTVRNPNLFELTFQPSAEKDITEFSPGSHTATIEYWPESKTYEEAKAAREVGSYAWSFNVG
jgi:hypothetical protein